MALVKKFAYGQNVATKQCGTHSSSFISISLSVSVKTRKLPLLSWAEFDGRPEGKGLPLLLFAPGSLAILFLRTFKME